MIVLAIIMIVKFFNIASDIEEIKNLLMEFSKKRHTNQSKKTNDDENAFTIGSHVIEKVSEKQMNIIAIEDIDGDKKYRCSPNGGITSKIYDEDKIELFSVYWEKKGK